MSGRDVVNAFFNTMNSAGTLAAIRTHGAPGFVWWSAGRGEIQDRAEEIEQLLGPHLDDKGLRLEIVGTTCEGNRVAVEARSFADFKSGAKYRNAYHFLFEVEGGKIKAMREYHDTAHANEVVGALLG